MKNTLERITSKAEDAEEWIRGLQDGVEITPAQQQKGILKMRTV